MSVDASAPVAIRILALINPEAGRADADKVRDAILAGAAGTGAVTPPLIH